jgi:hypothetical protein
MTDSVRERAERAAYKAEAPEKVIRPATSHPVLSSSQTASVRERAESAESRNTPEGEVAPRDHTTIAGTSHYSGDIGRVRDRVAARENTPVAPKPESLYEQECRCFGKYWADVYRRQRGEE